jgi:hypothetical protein
MTAVGLFCLQGLPQRVKIESIVMPGRRGITVARVGRLKDGWRLLVDGCGARRNAKEQAASLQTALLRNDGVRGPRYKPHERAPFEIRRSAVPVIARARWNARQQNSRALLSFGLTSSCYRVEQPFSRWLIGLCVAGERSLVHGVTLPCRGIVAFFLGEHGPEDAGMLVGNGNQSLVVTLASIERDDPALQSVGS